MSEERGVIKYETENGEVKLSPAIIKTYLASGNGKVTDEEVGLFLKLCQYQKLNPFLREAYLVKFTGQPATMIVGKEVFTKRAYRHPQFEGMKAGIVVTSIDGNIVEREGTILYPGESLLGGWAEAFRKDYRVPIKSTASMKEYCKMKDGKPMSTWSQMPATMIRKVALVQALREAFPDYFQGLYSEEEMPVDQSKLSREPVQVIDPEEDNSELISEITKIVTNNSEAYKKCELYVKQFKANRLSELHKEQLTNMLGLLNAEFNSNEQEASLEPMNESMEVEVAINGEEVKEHAEKEEGISGGTSDEFTD